MAAIFGVLPRGDPRAARLVDGTLADLEAGPLMHRYLPSEHDGFAGLEGTFLPVAWWAVAALAITGRWSVATVPLALPEARSAWRRK